MSGDPQNTRVWDECDIFIAFPDPSTGLEEIEVPAAYEDALSGDWEQVGYLEGDDGVTDSREWGLNDEVYAWGGDLIRLVRGQFKYTKKFTALEEASDVVYRLTWPGSTSSSIVTPRVERVLIAFEYFDNTMQVGRREVSAYQAEVQPDGDTQRKEGEVASTTFIATVFPSSDHELLIVQETAEGS